MVTRNILIICILFLFLDAGNAQESNKIDSYIELSAEFNKDTLTEADTLSIKLIFKNKTDSLVEFYPHALIMVQKPIVAFGQGSSLILDSVLNIKNIKKLHSDSSWHNIYKIPVNNKFFSKGTNKVSILYYMKRFEKRNRKYNQLFGKLSTSYYKLIIKD